VVEYYSFFVVADIDECAELPTICGPGICENTHGSYTCDCEPGYSKRQGDRGSVTNNKYSPLDTNQIKSIQGARTESSIHELTCKLRALIWMRSVLL